MIFPSTDKSSRFLPPACRLFFLVLAMLFALPCWAWNAAGHRLISLMAWEGLHAATRSEVSRLLRGHPDYEHWVINAAPGDHDRRAFIETSLWADLIRKDNRFYSHGREEPTPTLIGFPDMKRHADWHYVNYRLDGVLNDPPLSGQLKKQLVVLLATLASPNSSTTELSYALPWFIHLLGDAHQPLHTSIRPDAEGHADPQRQEFMVNNPFNPRKALSTLHAFWDDLPGPPWLNGTYLESKARSLSAAYPPSTPAAEFGASRLWIAESWRLARDYGYPPNADDLPTISAVFYENAREITHQRLTTAAYRLTAVLNTMFANKKGN